MRMKENGFGVGIQVKNNVEAVEFYKRVFGMELGYHEFFPEGHPRYGEYLHAEMLLDDKPIFAVQPMEPESGDFDEQRQIMSFGAAFENEADLRAAFDLLCDGGIVKEPLAPVPWSQCCATVIDKFGITWWISI